MQVQRALISVSDKTGLLEFARFLSARGVELIATQGTAAYLREHAFTVKDVSEVTGFPEIMQGRVKTLHPRIHGALLARASNDEEALAEHGIGLIDLLVVNLYPFADTIGKKDIERDDAIEQIDVGGPALIRAGAKNHERVAVLVDPGDYVPFMRQLGDGIDVMQRLGYAAKAFAHTAAYDGLVADWLGLQADRQSAPFAPTMHLSLLRSASLKYGENPHQKGAAYIERGASQGTIARAQLASGKTLSFNNLLDADAAWSCVREFGDNPACAIIKHTNPCGVALGENVLEAYRRAYGADPLSAFGGVLAFNAHVDVATAHAILEQQFVEVVVAPTVDEAALQAFAKKPNLRVLVTGPLRQRPDKAALDYKRIEQGMLVQEADQALLSDHDLQVVGKKQPSRLEVDDLLFAWKVAKYAKSNAIVLAKSGQTIGIGAGQTSRIFSFKIAAQKAQELNLPMQGSIAASDAFLPFRDSVDLAAKIGVSAIIQPGGSIKDPEVIKAADECGIVMIFTKTRQLRH